MTARRRVIASGIAVLIVLFLAIVFYRPVLFALGSLLTSSQAPVQSDIVVVLGGDYLGDRVLKGAELVREGYAPIVLVSGSGAMYGHTESDLAVAFAEAHGYPAGIFYASHAAATSTRDEADEDVAELRRRGIHRYILVTSPFHTARARRVFHRAAPDLQLTVVASPDPHWHNGQWWLDREGQKEWFFETTKTIADFFRL